MRTLFFLFCCLWGFVGLEAQNVQFRIGGGLATHYGHAEAVGAFKVGLGYEIEFDQHWTLTPAVSFYAKGWKDKNRLVNVFDNEGNQLFDEETGAPLRSVCTQSAAQNYIEVPLLLSYYWRTGPARYVVLSAGPYVAYGVGGKQKTKGNTELEGAQKLYYERQTFDIEGTHRFDAGLQAMVGYQFASGLLLGVEADFGLARFNRAGRRNLSGLLTLGYRL